MMYINIICIYDDSSWMKQAVGAHFWGKTILYYDMVVVVVGPNDSLRMCGCVGVWCEQSHVVIYRVVTYLHMYRRRRRNMRMYANGQSNTNSLHHPHSHATDEINFRVSATTGAISLEPSLSFRLSDMVRKLSYTNSSSLKPVHDGEIFRDRE
jgi:hypothetical protein